MAMVTIDPKVLEQVRAAAPATWRDRTSDIRVVLDVLAKHSTIANRRKGDNGDTFWQMHVKEIVAELAERGIVMGNRAVSVMLHGVGLVRVRRNDGSVIIWSEEQLNLLLDYYDM